MDFHPLDRALAGRMQKPPLVTRLVTRGGFFIFQVLSIHVEHSSVF